MNNLKFSLIALLLVLLGVGIDIRPVFTQTDDLPTSTYHCETITEDTVWTADTIHVITCRVRVQSNVDLIIEAGSTVVAHPSSSFEVYGNLIIRGTRSMPVIIRGEQSAGSWFGTWNGIRFYPGSSGALNFVHFSDAGEHFSDDPYSPRDVGIRIFSPDVTISDSRFTNNYDTIIYSTEPTVIERSFFDFASKSEIRADAPITITRSVFTNGRAYKNDNSNTTYMFKGVIANSTVFIEDTFFRGSMIHIGIENFANSSITGSFFNNSNGADVLLSGVVSSNVTFPEWTRDITALVFSRIRVAEGAELTLQPGNTFKFQPYSDFIIDGILTAIGTESRLIRFIGADSRPITGYWGGLTFSASSEGVLKHMVIQDAGDRDRNADLRTERAVEIFSANVEILNSHLTQNNGTTLYTTESITITQSVFSNVDSNGYDIYAVGDAQVEHTVPEMEYDKLGIRYVLLTDQKRNDSPDSYGDGDGIPECGETVAINIAAQNHGSKTFQNLTGKVINLTGGVIVLSTEKNRHSLDKGSESTYSPIGSGAYGLADEPIVVSLDGGKPPANLDISITFYARNLLPTSHLISIPIACDAQLMGRVTNYGSNLQALNPSGVGEVLVVAQTDTMSHSTVTDENGFYYFNSLDTDNYTISINTATSREVALPHATAVAIEQGNITTADFKLADCSSEFQLATPPVMLVEGWGGSVGREILNQSSNLFKFEEFLGDEGYIEGCNLFYALEVSPKNTIHENAYVIKQNLCQYYKAAANENALGQDWNGHFTIVAHSYGGINTRAFLENSDLYKANCPNAGHRVWIDNLITLGTPHNGGGLDLAGAVKIAWGHLKSNELRSVLQVLPEGMASYNLSHEQPEDTCYRLVAGNFLEQINPTNVEHLKVLTIFQIYNSAVEQTLPRYRIEEIWSLNPEDLIELSLLLDPNDLGVYVSSSHVLALEKFQSSYPNVETRLTSDAHGLEKRKRPYDLITLVDSISTFDDHVKTGLVNACETTPQILSPHNYEAIQRSMQTQLTYVETQDENIFESKFRLEDNNLSFWISWPSSEIDISLISPDGTIINQASLPDISTVDHMQMGVLGNSSVFFLQEPMPGEWTYRITSLDGSGIPPHQIYTFDDLPVALSLSADQQSPMVGQSYPITASLEYSGNLATESLVITATVTDPTSVSTVLTLYDDGLHSDGLANDGVFGAMFDGVYDAGPYIVEITASGILSNTAFRRDASNLIYGVLEHPYFTGNYTETSPQLFKNKNTSIVIGVEVSAPYSGTFQLSGYLGTESLAYEHAVTFARLVTGTHVISLTYPVNSFAAEDLAEPLKLTNLRLHDLNYGMSLLSHKPLAYVTNPYDSSQLAPSIYVDPHHGGAMALDVGTVDISVEVASGSVTEQSTVFLAHADESANEMQALIAESQFYVGTNENSSYSEISMLAKPATITITSEDSQLSLTDNDIYLYRWHAEDQLWLTVGIDRVEPAASSNSISFRITEMGEFALSRFAGYPPVAHDDEVQLLEDSSTTVDVLENDTDSEGASLEVVTVTQPVNGVVVINPDHTVSLTPTVDFSGVITFYYSVSDGSGMDTGLVLASVEPVNDPPLAVNDSDVTLENTPVVLNVLSNDSDPDGDTLTITSNAQPANAIVTIQANNTLVLTPSLDFNGVVTFTYTITDGNGASDSAEVIITVQPVNDPPIAVSDSVTTTEETAVQIDVLANDSAGDVGDTITLTALTQPANGSAAIVGQLVEFTPELDFNGLVTLTYAISDTGGLVDVGLVTINVTPVNDAPDAVNDVVWTNEDTPVVAAVLENDSDPDGDTLQVTQPVSATSGSAVVNVDSTITYTPAQDATQPVNITYTVADGNGDIDSAVVTVYITAVNDMPLAVNDSGTVDEDASVQLDVLANDSDVDGDTLTVANVTQTLVGVVAQGAGNTLVYTPTANFNGVVTFTYEAYDGVAASLPALVTIAVQPVNDAPGAIDDTAATLEDVSVTVDVLANDSDLDGDLLQVISVGSPAAGVATVTANQVVYTPNLNFNGSDVFTYTIADGQGGTASAAVAVAVATVNDGPTASNDLAQTDEDTAVAIDVLTNDIDDDGDPLTVVSITQSADGSAVLDGQGNVVVTPTLNFNGVLTLTYTISDGQSGDSADIIITVLPVNDAPTAVNDVAVTDEETFVSVDVLANDSDVDGDSLTIAQVASSLDGTAAITANSLVGFTPTVDFNGTAVVSYTIDDGSGATASALLLITVDPINDVPIAVNDIGEAVAETPVTLSVLDNDSDIDGDTLTIAAVGNPANGTASTDGSTVLYTPALAFVGSDTFTYTVTDGNGGFANATVSMTVTPKQIDLAVTIVESADSSLVEDTLVYTMTVINNGPQDATDVVLTDILPQGTTFITATAAQGVCTDDTATVTCPLGNLAVGVSTTVVVTIVPEEIGVITNTVSITATETDIVPSNNSVVESTTINAAYMCAGHAATIIGTPGDDVLNGTEGVDVIVGRGGNDTIRGLGDDDIICGGDGDDDIRGGDGNDTLKGGKGEDVLRGDDGNDTLIGGRNADTLIGGAGDDELEGSHGNDDLNGGNGNDLLIGGDGSDLLEGKSGNDDLRGNGGADILLGGAGEDTLLGGKGNDWLEGGAAADELRGNNGDDNLEGDAGDDSLFGGSGFDSLDGGSGTDACVSGESVNRCEP